MLGRLPALPACCAHHRAAALLVRAPLLRV
jgi:hypothetical protein